MAQRKSSHDKGLRGGVAMKSAHLTILLSLACAVGAEHDAGAQKCPPEYLTASDGAIFQNFGYSLSLSAPSLAIGAFTDSELGIEAGAAYVFVRQNGSFSEVQKLFGLDQVAGDWFGHSVDVDVPVGVFTAPSHFHVPDKWGAVYIFRLEDTRWSEVQEVHASSGSFQDNFATAVAVDGDVIVIGAPLDDDNGLSSGSAYIVRYNGMLWDEEQKLLVSDGESGDFFGEAVALLGDVALIGANGEDSHGFGSQTGAAFVFRFDGSDWIEEQKIVPADVLNQDRFGESVALGPGIALIGSPYDHSDPAVAGAVYVFTFDGKKWVQAQEILPPPDDGPKQFGHSVALDGDLALVGAFAGNPPGESNGAAYLYRFDGTTWNHEHTFLPEPNATTNFFGFAVDIDDGLAAIGAPGETGQSGAVYVFDVDPIPAELDCDGVVGPSDLAELLAQWGQCPIDDGCAADLSPPPDGDGVVGPPDLAQLLANWTT